MRHADLLVLHTQIIASGPAPCALAAGQVAFYRDAITNAAIGHILPDCFDHTCPFMSGGHGVAREAFWHGASQYLDIRATQAAVGGADDDFARTALRIVHRCELKARGVRNQDRSHKGSWLLV